MGNEESILTQSALSRAMVGKVIQYRQLVM